MDLLIVLVNYNRSDLTIDCLKSLAPELEALPNARVVICDNGSKEGEVATMAAAIDTLNLGDCVALRSITPNQGFTGGNNVVIREALAEADPPEAVMLLNNDTLVRPGAIQEIVRFLKENPNAGMCASRLEYPGGESQRAARRTLSIASEFEAFARIGLVSKLLSRWLVAPEESEETSPRVCDWAPGAALVMRHEVLSKVGLLDEGLYTYFDDVDYCLRAKRAGWPTWYLPASRIVHLVGRTTGITQETDRPKRRPPYWFCARRRFFLNNHGPVYAALVDLAAIAGLLLYKLRQFLLRRPNADPPHLLRDMIRHSVLATGFRTMPVLNPLTGAPVRTTSIKMFPA